jgi:hypothetical protein
VITGGVVRSAAGVLLMTLLSRKAVEKDEIRIGFLSIPHVGALYIIEELHLLPTVILLPCHWRFCSSLTFYLQKERVTDGARTRDLLLSHNPNSQVRSRSPVFRNPLI